MTFLKNTVVAVLMVIGFDATRRETYVFAETAKKSEVIKKQVVVVEINPTATVDARVVRLGDIATITGGDAGIRDRLKNLDLEDIVEPGETITIMPSQIEFRMQIAGLDIDRVSIQGHSAQVTSGPVNSTRESDLSKGTGSKTPGLAIVKQRRPIDFIADSPDEGPLEREIVRAGRECVLRKLPWPEEDVSVRLTQLISNEIRSASSAEGYRFSAELRSSGPAVGRVQVRVVAEASKRPTFDVSFILEVRHFDNLVLAKRTIERGQKVAADDLYFDRQDVTELQDYCTTTTGLIGMTAKRTIRGLVAVKANDVDQTNSADNEVLIRRGEQVKMSANVGALNVYAMGESQQEGRLGETIRLRNIESKVIVKGKVIGSGEVEIAF